MLPSPSISVRAADDDVAARVGRAQRGQRRPAADVVPAERARDDAQAGRLLHDAVVDRDRRRVGVAARDDRVGGSRAATAASSSAPSAGRWRRASSSMRPRGQEEHPRVPQVLARGDVALGGRAVGLLEEAADVVDGVRARARQPRAQADVAEAGLGVRRHHADGDDRLARLGDREAHQPRERRLVGDERVGGQHGDDRVRAGAPLRGHRAQADRGGGVARAPARRRCWPAGRSGIAARTASA